MSSLNLSKSLTVALATQNFNNPMQYIISEEEYKQLIRRDDVIKPLDEFVASASKRIKDAGGGANHYDHPFISGLSDDLKTFRSKVKL